MRGGGVTHEVDVEVVVRRALVGTRLEAGHVDVVGLEVSEGRGERAGGVSEGEADGRLLQQTIIDGRRRSGEGQALLGR